MPRALAFRNFLLLSSSVPRLMPAALPASAAPCTAPTTAPFNTPTTAAPTSFALLMTSGDGFFFADFLPALFFAVVTDADFLLADFLLDFFDGMFLSLVDNQSASEQTNCDRALCLRRRQRETSRRTADSDCA